MVKRKSDLPKKVHDVKYDDRDNVFSIDPALVKKWTKHNKKKQK